jgi:DNA polymerase-3 subunit alpha
MLFMVKSVISDLEYESKKNIRGQLSFFDMGGDDMSSISEPLPPAVEEFSKDELLFMENEVAGMYLSGHPIDEYNDFIKAVKCDKIGNILDTESRMYKDNGSVHIVCIVSKLKNQVTKNNRMMAFVTVEDRYGSIEAIVFPDAYSRCGGLLVQGNVVEIFGTVNLKEDEEPKIICNEIRKVDKNSVPQTSVATPKKPSSKPPKLFIRIDNLESALYKKAFRVLDIFEGRTPVIFYLTDTNKKLIAPEKMWVSLNDVMIKELKHQLGDENVVVQ